VSQVKLVCSDLTQLGGRGCDHDGESYHRHGDVLPP
jgi:hypothetical protein